MADLISIELLLDAEAEIAVRREWDALAEAGLSSLALHTAASNRPHITLIARTTEVSDSVADIARFLPLDLTLGPPVLFGQGDRRVLARMVIATSALLGLHTDAHEAAGPGEDAPHTQPGVWIPHVTLARRLRMDALPQALAFSTGDILARAVALRRWDAVTRTVTMLGGTDAAPSEP